MMEAARPKITDMLEKLDREEAEMMPISKPRLLTKSTTDEECVRVYWPQELTDLRHEFRRFIEAMAFKLRKNADKRITETDLPELFTALRAEVASMEQAARNGNTIETLLESADAANFCMLIAAVAMQRGIK